MTAFCSSPEEALADIAPGASVGIGGFGMNYRFPKSLIKTLLDKGTDRLTVVCNSLGQPGPEGAHALVEQGRVKTLVASFSSRPNIRSDAEERARRGEMSIELVPQGILVERLRAAGAGIPAFFSPVGVGTRIAAGKEARAFGGREHVLEQALPIDYALIRAASVDRWGNVAFAGSSINLNKSFAKAARIVIVETDEIRDEPIPADRIDLPRIFVDRVVVSRHPPTLPAANAMKRRGAESRRLYERANRHGLSREEMARRVAGLFDDGWFVNLGTGMPTLVADHLAGRDVHLHGENGILGYGPRVTGEDVDLDLYDAAGGFVRPRPGMSLFDSVESFEMARGGHLDAVVLGAYQVDERGSLANWTLSEDLGGGIGGAMDLVAGTRQVIAMLEHVDSKGAPKLLERCSLPPTREGCLTAVVTDIALFVRDGERGMVLRETAPGFSVGDVKALTPMAFSVPDEVGDMAVSDNRLPVYLG